MVRMMTMTSRVVLAALVASMMLVMIHAPPLMMMMMMMTCSLVVVFVFVGMLQHSSRFHTVSFGLPTGEAVDGLDNKLTAAIVNIKGHCVGP